MEESKLLHGRFWTHFRMLVGQFRALLKVLAAHLRGEALHYVVAEIIFRARVSFIKQLVLKDTDKVYKGLKCFWTTKSFVTSKRTEAI